MKVMGYMLIAFFLLIYPICLGKFLSTKIKKDYCKGICFCYVLGFTVVIASFQLVCVPLSILNISFNTVVILFLSLSIILFLLSLSQIRIKELFAFQLNERVMNSETIGLIACLLLIILCQIGALVLYGVYQWGADDAAYLAISDSAIKHNVLFRFNPYTGAYEGILVNKKTLTVSYHIFISFLGKISGIHVLEIAHTILPVFLIPLSYCTFYLFSKLLFGTDLKKCIVFMIILSLLITWGGYSIYTITFRMLVAPWQGKALMATIFLPFLFYYVFQIFVNDWNYLEAIILLSICIAGQSTSLMANGLFAFTVLAVFLCSFKFDKKLIIKNIRLLSCFFLICSFDILFYLFYNNIINILGLK